MPAIETTGEAPARCGAWIRLVLSRHEICGRLPDLGTGFPARQHNLAALVDRDGCKLATLDGGIQHAAVELVGPANSGSGASSPS